MDVSREVQSVRDWIVESVTRAGCKGVVFGLSGGIDSAVVAALSKKAFPYTSLAVAMPCESNSQDEEDARLIAQELGLDIRTVNLDKTYNSLVKELDEEVSELAAANIKPRLRMTTLYYYAQKNNYLVLGGSNKSELTIGYFTKHGDSGADLLPIADFNKREVFELAKYLGINKKIIDKKPSAGLWKGQTDEEEMGIKYEDIDRYIDGREISDKATLERIKSMESKSMHKRSYPPIFKRK